MNVIQIAGQLAGGGVLELERECRAAGLPIALDLSNLRWADSEGVQLLKTFVDKGAQLRGMSPYVEILLKREPS
ncbi:MAG: hypothetical protein JRH15_18935 [Deltaproteobacteria bacterium]|nr:hypothetical protein [Deltaproteobacteria bacterium]